MNVDRDRPDDHGRDLHVTPEKDRGRETEVPLDDRRSRETYEALVDALPLSVLIKDVNGRRIFANRAYLKLRGKTIDEILFKRDVDLFPSPIAEKFRDDDQTVMSTKVALHDVEETVDASGNRRYIERVKSPIFDQQDRVVGVQLIFWDVTDRTLAEQQLRHERGLLDTLMGNLPDAIYFKDSDSRFVRISAAMAKKFGLPSSESAVGKTDADIFTEEHARAARRDELQIMETQQPIVDLMERETWPDRDDTWCLSTKMPLLDADGNSVGTYGISRDVTELKRYQDELREARDVADRANRAKSDFLANMSHEIRTPMNAIIGMSGLLAQTELNNEQHDYIKLVQESAESLLSLLNEILDFSKIESKKLELESIPFSLRDLIGKAGQTLSVRAAEKGLELACRVAPEIPDRLVGDPGRLRQILLNLLGNATKFTDEGEVLVEVSIDEEDGEPTEQRKALPLKFAVSDTGIGIPSEMQSAVLAPFTQADASTTRRFGGTGLGLAISRQLVELMGGSLSLDSKPGYGTQFYFTCPFLVAEQQQVNHESELESLEDLEVLLVDDNDTNLRILNEIFTSWKLRPTLADRGSGALQAIDEADRTGRPFRLAILDCMMPEMDGFELAKRIRRDHPRGELQLIILSSAARGDEIERCRQLDVARYLTKPVVQSELLDTVLSVLRVRGPALPTSRESLPDCKPMRVLVAEDGLANQHVAVGMLQAAGHRPVVVSDGRETVARWRSEPFDLILMDMHMPVMDGIEATETIRSHERIQGGHIPIIALTAAAMKEDAEACREAGMDDYLAKPIHPRELQATMAKFAPETSVLERSETLRGENRRGYHGSRPKRVAQNPDTPDPREEPNASEGDDQNDRIVPTDVIDLRAAATRVPGGLPGVRRLAEVFRGECADLMTTLREEIPGGDSGTIQRAAHTLKGSANLFFAHRVRLAAQEIEHHAHDDDPQGLILRLQELEGEVERMLAALDSFLQITSH